MLQLIGGHRGVATRACRQVKRYGMDMDIVYCIDMMSDGDNSTLTGFDGKSTATTQTAGFFDSGWLLAAAVEFYIHYAVIAIGIFGTAANAVVLYALFVHNARETKKRMVNWLIINQNLIDLCSCVTIVVCLSIKVSNIYLTGALGYVLCTVFITENPAMCLLNASVINLVTITVERYVKVVYPFWSKKNLKHWMITTAIVFAWIAGCLSIGPVTFVTSFVAEGDCKIFELYWKNAEIRVGYGVWNFVSFFLIPLIVFVYCYGHMVVMMRKQMRVMAGHNVGGGSQAQTAYSQAHSKRIKWNIIKTMIIVSAFFSVCWAPLNVYILALENMNKSELAIGYVVVLFLPYVNIVLNPFIYSSKHEGVRRVLTRAIVCRRSAAAAAVGNAAGISISNAGHKETQTTRN